MQKFLACHFGYCQYMDLKPLRNSFCFTQVQFCQNSHTESICVTFWDVTKCWKPVPVVILFSPEGCCMVAQPELLTPVPCETAQWHGTEVVPEQPDLICMLFDLCLWKMTKVLAEFTARHFPPAAPP